MARTRIVVPDSIMDLFPHKTDLEISKELDIPLYTVQGARMYRGVPAFSPIGEQAVRGGYIATNLTSAQTFYEAFCSTQNNINNAFYRLAQAVEMKDNIEIETAKTRLRLRLEELNKFGYIHSDAINALVEATAAEMITQRDMANQEGDYDQESPF